MTTTWRPGDGAVALDDHGVPTTYVHDQLPTNASLLSQPTDSWHTADRCWGAGFDHGPWRRIVGSTRQQLRGSEGASQRFRLTDRLRPNVQNLQRLPPGATRSMHGGGPFLGQGHSRQPR